MFTNGGEAVAGQEVFNQGEGGVDWDLQQG